MNILLVGPPEFNSTDGVIIQGVKNLLRYSYPDCVFHYKELKDHVYMDFSEFNIGLTPDLFVVCGTPWLWDSFQNSIKYKNLVTFKEFHAVKTLFMGIGSCLYIKDIDSEILERPEEQEALHYLYDNTTVIVRDHLAAEKLDKAGIQNHYFPCPAYFAYGVTKPTLSIKQTRNVMVWIDPTKSISGAIWHDPQKLDDFYSNYNDFYFEYDNVEVYIAKEEDRQSAVDRGYDPILLTSVTDTLQLMQQANRVLSGRIHCAVPAIVQEAYVQWLPLDSRYFVLEDFAHLSTFPFLADYDKVLKSII